MISISAIGYLGFALYKQIKVAKHLLIVKNTSTLEKFNLTLPILKDMEIFTHRDFQNGNLPKTKGFDLTQILSSKTPGVMKYASNIMYSYMTTSTSKVLDSIDSINTGLLYISEFQTQGIGRTGP